MTSLKPDENIQKVLISTPSRLTGQYEKEGILISPAHQDIRTQSGKLTLNENPFCRNAYVVVFCTPQIDENHRGPYPEYEHMGDLICSYLSILYGKRFDNHGLLEDKGIFRLPHFELPNSMCNPNLPQNNHKPRKKLEIPLNLSEITRIERLLIDKSLGEKFRKFLGISGKFYMLALQNFEKNPEVAYLNLIMAGEVLSQYFDKSKSHNYVKKRFTKTIEKLTNKYFFSQSYCENSKDVLKEDDFKKRIEAAHTIRSKFVHEGLSFEELITRGSFSRHGEIQPEGISFNDEDLKEYLKMLPTYYGMESVIRFCLLRFIHVYGKVAIDPLLND